MDAGFGNSLIVSLAPPSDPVKARRHPARPKRNCAHRRPGFVRTDTTQHGRGAADWPGTEERFAARAMMGRIGEPEDIANAVVFLASRESGWITAQVLTVDGVRRADGLHWARLDRALCRWRVMFADGQPTAPTSVWASPLP